MVLASRYEMKSTEALRLPSSGANRVALIATLEGWDDVPIEIGCIHLSANGAVPPTAGFPSWDAERLAQFDAVSARLKERAKGRPTLLMGDMNFGKANGPTVTDNKRPLYDHAVELGFASPAADASPAFCSSCKSNLLKDGAAGTDTGTLIDHVLMRDLGNVMHPTGAARHLIEPVTVTGYHGEPVVTHPSDHYDVSVTFAHGAE
jgi:endonuclease/exonuclease/phosphatase family metal-dependent hydrolase